MNTPSMYQAQNLHPTASRHSASVRASCDVSAYCLLPHSTMPARRQLLQGVPYTEALEQTVQGGVAVVVVDFTAEVVVALGNKEEGGGEGLPTRIEVHYQQRARVGQQMILSEARVL